MIVAVPPETAEARQTPALAIDITMSEVVSGTVAEETREEGFGGEAADCDIRPPYEDLSHGPSSNNDETMRENITSKTAKSTPHKSSSNDDPRMTDNLTFTKESMPHNPSSNDNVSMTENLNAKKCTEAIIITDSNTRSTLKDIQEKEGSKDDRTSPPSTITQDIIMLQPEAQGPPPSRVKDRASRPRKRARKMKYDANDPRRFLDVEAEVSNDEEGDDEENAGLDDFINDAPSESDGDAPLPIIQSRDSTHRHEDDARMVDSEDEWGSEEEMLDWYDDPATTSHNAVMELMSTEEANQAWHFYLDEERRQAELEALDRARHPDDRHWYPDPVPDTVPQELIPDSIVPLLPRPAAEKHLWRVAVK
ncbi:hypothetical protein H0H92_010137, partial [Tricholoma furcatifolium]